MKIIYESEQLLNESIYEYVDPETLEIDLKGVSEDFNVKKINDTKLRIYFRKKSFVTVDLVFNPEISFVLEDYFGKKIISTATTLKGHIVDLVAKLIKR